MGAVTLEEIACMIDSILDTCWSGGNSCDVCPINVPDNDYTCGHYLVRLVLDAPREGVEWSKSGELNQTINETGEDNGGKSDR